MKDNGGAQSVRQVPKETYPQALKAAGNKVSQPRDKAPKPRRRPTAFDYTFRATVLPDLKRAAQRLAWAIHHGAGFAEALDTLIAIALERGAGKLSDPDGLIDFLTDYFAACCGEQP